MSRYALIPCFLFSLLCYPQSTPQPRLAVPSYTSPTAPEWNRWESLGPRIVGLMILNLNNGDDTRRNPDIVAAVKRTQRSDILVLGYIHTGYGKRNPAEIRPKIDGVMESYGVDGIFLDETPTDCNAPGKYSPSNLAYYEALADYIRGKPGKHLVVLNPGTLPENDCWMKVSDILLTFEEPTLSNYETHYVDREWTRRYGPERFWHLVYSVPSADEMRQIVKLARQRGVGWIYVTDDGPDNNPWDTPATYLVSEATEWTGIKPEIAELPNQSSVHRVSIQWSGMKGLRSQILLDVDKTTSTGYRSPGTTLGADLMLEMPGDGTAKMMRYNGSGDDWKWTPVEAHVALQRLDKARTLGTWAHQAHFTTQHVDQLGQFIQAGSPE